MTKKIDIWRGAKLVDDVIGQLPTANVSARAPGIQADAIRTDTDISRENAPPSSRVIPFLPFFPYLPYFPSTSRTNEPPFAIVPALTPGALTRAAGPDLVHVY